MHLYDFKCDNPSKTGTQMARGNMVPICFIQGVPKNMNKFEREESSLHLKSCKSTNYMRLNGKNCNLDLY